MTPDNNSPTSMRLRFLDWPVAVLFSIALHVLILYSFFFAPAPLPLPDLIEISVVFEEPETVRSSADRQTVLAEAQAMRREEPKPEKTAAPQAVAGKTSKETAKPDAPSRAERTQTKHLAEQVKAKIKTKTKTKTKKKISTPTKHARPKPKLEDTHLAVHRRVPHLDRPVKPAAAAAIRAIRAHEPRIVGEDRGQTVVRDDRYRRSAARAVARYKRAANQGYVMATYNLGRALAEGRGVGRDNKKAVEFFRNAAQQGNVPAILRLAEMHLAGLGTLEDRVEAQALYSVAASLGTKAPRSPKVMLAVHLDDGQQGRARQRALALRELFPPMDLNRQGRKEQELRLAAAKGNLGMVNVSLQSGVDANAIDDEGCTALIVAAWRGHRQVLQALMLAGSDIDAVDNKGRTALNWAAINGYREITHILLLQSALVDVRDDSGLTPLMRAAWNGHEEIVTALIEGQADLNAADDRGITALSRAKSQMESSIVARLDAAGAR